MSQLPGQIAGETYTPRRIVLSDHGLIYAPGGVIDANNAYDGSNTGYEFQIRVGTPMARITATKLWVPCKRTTTNGAGSSSTTLVVHDARAFKAGDSIIIGSNSAVSISAINYATNTLTLASAETWSDTNAVHANDGSETCRGFLDEWVNLKDVHFDGQLRNKPFGKLVVEGYLDYAMVLGDLNAIRADTGAFIAGIRWNDQQGQT
jgi:hypothetical protein